MHQQRRRKLSGQVWRTSTADFGQCAKRWQTQPLSTLGFGSHMRCKVGRYQTHHHLVLWHRSLEHNFTTCTAACTAACYESRTVRHQTQRLLAGAKARGQQLGVNVQKHHHISTIDAM